MLACEPAPAKLGKGKKFSIACPTGVIREAGMMLPGNGVTGLVVGSLMAVSVPLFCRLCEKLPVRSSAVGVYLVCVPPDTTAIDLNYDALYPWGRAVNVVLTGAERTTVWPLAQQIAKRVSLAIEPDAQPEQGHYFRSDHFSFAHAGIPAFSIEHATEFAGKPAGWGEKAWEEYNSKHYHQPSDEFQPDWDFTALQQAAEYGFLLGKEIANQDKLPDWLPGDQFRRK